MRILHVSDISKPRVCQIYTLHAGRLSRKQQKSEEKSKTTTITQTVTNKELSVGGTEIAETTEITKTTGMRGANHGFKQRVYKYLNLYISCPSQSCTWGALEEPSRPCNCGVKTSLSSQLCVQLAFAMCMIIDESESIHTATANSNQSL